MLDSAGSTLVEWGRQQQQQQPIWGSNDSHIGRSKKFDDSCIDYHEMFNDSRIDHHEMCYFCSGFNIIIAIIDMLALHFF